MMAALFSNPNWDSEKANRAQRIKELDGHYNRAIELIYDPDIEDEDEPDWDNPFWQGHLRGIARTRVKWGLDTEGTEVGDHLSEQQRTEIHERIQSRAHRQQLRENVDQLARRD